MPRDVRTHTFGGIASGGGAFFEGSPGDAASPVEPDVAAQWLMDEASGAVVDEVAALSCAVSGTPTYSVTAISSFAGWSPGITYADGGTQRHLNSTPGTQVELGVGGGTVELGFSFVNASSTSRFLVECGDASTGGFFIRINPSTRQLFASIIGDDLTSVTATGTMPVTWNNGSPHKVRASFDRDSLLTRLFFDGLQLTVADLTPLDGVNVPGPRVSIGNTASGSLSCGCTIWYVRISKNSTNNCGGPGGG